MSSSTFSRRLSIEFGLRSQREARTLHLTPVTNKKRLDFARHDMMAIGLLLSERNCLVFLMTNAVCISPHSY